MTMPYTVLGPENMQQTSLGLPELSSAVPSWRETHRAGCSVTVLLGALEENPDKEKQQSPTPPRPLECIYSAHSEAGSLLSTIQEFCRGENN